MYSTVKVRSAENPWWKTRGINEHRVGAEMTVRNKYRNYANRRHQLLGSTPSLKTPQALPYKLCTASIKMLSIRLPKEALNSGDGLGCYTSHCWISRYILETFNLTMQFTLWPMQVFNWGQSSSKCISSGGMTKNQQGIQSPSKSNWLSGP